MQAPLLPAPAPPSYRYLDGRGNKIITVSVHTPGNYTNIATASATAPWLVFGMAKTRLRHRPRIGAKLGSRRVRVWRNEMSDASLLLHPDVRVLTHQAARVLQVTTLENLQYEDLPTSGWKPFGRLCADLQEGVRTLVCRPAPGNSNSELWINPGVDHREWPRFGEVVLGEDPKHFHGKCDGADPAVESAMLVLNGVGTVDPCVPGTKAMMVSPSLLAFLRIRACFKPRTPEVLLQMKQYARQWQRKHQMEDRAFYSIMATTIAKAMELTVEERMALNVLDGDNVRDAKAAFGVPGVINTKHDTSWTFRDVIAGRVGLSRAVGAFRGHAVLKDA